MKALTAAAALALLAGCEGSEPVPPVPEARPVDTAAPAAPAPASASRSGSAPAATTPAARVKVEPAIAAFYKQNGFRPLWVSRSGLSEGGEALLELLASSASDGLDPAAYRLGRLREAAAAAGRDPAQAARAELMLSQAFLRYARDLYRPRDASDVYFVDDELAPSQPAARLLLDEAAAAPSLTRHLAELRAINPVYDALRRSYAQHRGRLDARSRRLVLANLERARALGRIQGRAVIVDAAGANLWMVDNGRVEGAMKVIVGKPDMPTPEMAAYIRYASLNPYWNLPPDLAQVRARRVLKSGLGVIRSERLEILSDWSDEAKRVDPARVDWKAAASGAQELRMRQLPGPDNMMGRVKFMFPNRLGIYLHDTPFTDKFRLEDLGVSSGCVRLADAERLSRWLFNGRKVAPRGAAAEQRVDLPEPVPVYITYLTAAPGNNRIVFQPDRYKRDKILLARLEKARDRA